MHRTQVKLTDKQIKAVRALANSKGMSMDEIIRMSIDDYIESVGSGMLSVTFISPGN